MAYLGRIEPESWEHTLRRVRMPQDAFVAPDPTQATPEARNAAGRLTARPMAFETETVWGTADAAIQDAVLTIQRDAAYTAARVWATPTYEWIQPHWTHRHAAAPVWAKPGTPVRHLGTPGTLVPCTDFPLAVYRPGESCLDDLYREGTPRTHVASVPGTVWLYYDDNHAGMEPR